MKRVLLLSTSPPMTGSGTGERTLSIYNAIRKVADTHFIHLFAGGRQTPGSESSITLSLFQPGGDTTWYWRKRKYLLADYRIEKHIFDTIAQYHKKFQFHAFFCRYFLTSTAGCDKLGPTLLDFDDFPDQMPGPKIPGWNIIGSGLMKSRLASYKTVFVTKQHDRSKVPHHNVQILPCISTVSRTGINILQKNKRLLFVGSLRWPPNREGILRFINTALPPIRRILPEVVLRVVGEDSEKLNGLPGVSGGGFVDDLEIEYLQSRVVICPIYSGSGSNVKLAEAAQFGMAIVASINAAKGFEGLLLHDRDLLIARCDMEMIDFCITLLQNDEFCVKLGNQARVTAGYNLGQGAIDRIINNALAECWS